MVDFELVKVYNWASIKELMCQELGISNDLFRDYHKVVRGAYKDCWYVMVDDVIPGNMSNGSIVMMFSHLAYDCYSGDEAWKGSVLKAWNRVYAKLDDGSDSGILVRFCW